MKTRRLRTRNRILVRQRPITKIVYIVAFVFITKILVSILTINVVTPLDAYAISTYYTIVNNEWKTNSAWSGVSNGSGTCTCNPGCNSNTAMKISHAMTVNSTSCGNFKFSGGAVVDLLSGGKLTINVPFEVSGGSVVNVAAGDSLIINNDVLLSGGSGVNVSGVIKINGNVTFTGGSFISGPGVGILNGTASGPGWTISNSWVLPIKLVYFKGALNDGNSVSLKWQTASEINNEYFSIERSSDGVHYSELAKVGGNGNSTIKLDYSWVDDSPVSGDNYYRLSQTDYDGKHEKCAMTHIKNNIKEGFCKVYPNPVFSGADLNISPASDATTLSFNMYDQTGKCILTRKLENVKSNDELTFPMDEIAAGNYIYKITDSNKNALTGKVMVR